MEAVTKWMLGAAVATGLLFWWHADAHAQPASPPAPPAPPSPPLPPRTDKKPAAPVVPAVALPDPPKLGATISSPGTTPQSWTEVVLTQSMIANYLDLYNNPTGDVLTLGAGTHLFVFSPLAGHDASLVMDYTGQSYMVHGDLSTSSKMPDAGTTKFPRKPLVLLTL